MNAHHKIGAALLYDPAPLIQIRGLFIAVRFIVQAFIVFSGQYDLLRCARLFQKRLHLLRQRQVDLLLQGAVDTDFAGIPSSVSRVQDDHRKLFFISRDFRTSRYGSGCLLLPNAGKGSCQHKHCQKQNDSHDKFHTPFQIHSLRTDPSLYHMPESPAPMHAACHCRY